MIHIFCNHSTNYLEENISSDEYIQVCKKLYYQLLSQPEKCIELDLMVMLPFLHEFAYCPYTECELRTQVQYALSVLNRKQLYCHSLFCKVPFPKETDETAFQLYTNYNDITLTDIQLAFTHFISNPLTIKDVLNNLIFDMISKLDLHHPSESCFDYVNCEENISISQLKDRLFLLLSYYVGINACYIHIGMFPNSKTCYTIL